MIVYVFVRVCVNVLQKCEKNALDIFEAPPISVSMKYYQPTW